MKILVIDDEPLVRMTFERLGRSRGHEVLSCEEGESGLREWRSSDPDLVILDVLLPGRSGPEILQEMKGANKAKVVLISAYSGEYEPEKVMAMGAHLFIPKPFNDIFAVMDQLEKLVRTP